MKVAIFCGLLQQKGTVALFSSGTNLNCVLLSCFLILQSGFVSAASCLILLFPWLPLGQFGQVDGFNQKLRTQTLTVTSPSVVIL